MSISLLGGGTSEFHDFRSWSSRVVAWFLSDPYDASPGQHPKSAGLRVPHIWVYASMCVYVYIYIYIMYIPIFVYVDIHTYTYIYICICHVPRRLQPCYLWTLKSFRIPSNAGRRSIRSKLLYHISHYSLGKVSKVFPARPNTAQ